MEKQYEDFNFFERLVDSFICFVEKKLYRKKWTYSDKTVIPFGMEMILEDLEINYEK